MKKIIFVCINMNIGGTEKALLTMLENIPHNKYDITLLMLKQYGGFLEKIPESVKIKYLDGFDRLETLISKPPLEVVRDCFKKRAWIQALALLGISIWCKWTKERTAFFRYILKGIKLSEEGYDLAVAYAGPMDLISYLVINHVHAKRKAQWIHFDITKIGFNVKFAEKVYKKFDKIFVVSKEGKEKLIQAVPRLANKTEVFFNMINADEIRKEAETEQNFQQDDSEVRLVTVGRLSEEKGQYRCIEAVARLKQEGYKVKWYAVGDGPCRKQYEEMAEELKVVDSCIFVGAKMNPYPYMKNSDIYIQPSSHEGYCITLTEAKLFNHPIVTTHFTGADEQIKDGQTGLIVNMDSEAIFKAIKQLLDEPELYNQMSEALKSENQEPSNQLYKLYELLGE